jgi:hypothetical protein
VAAGRGATYRIQRKQLAGATIAKRRERSVIRQPATEVSKMRTKITKRSLALLLCSCLCLGAIACGGELVDEGDGERSPTMMNSGIGFTEGGPCTVTEGQSKGKTGTYDEDGWCCVDGGMTCVECEYPDGTSRCKDGASLLLLKPVRLTTGTMFQK